MLQIELWQVSIDFPFDNLLKRELRSQITQATEYDLQSPKQIVLPPHLPPPPYVENVAEDQGVQRQNDDFKPPHHHPQDIKKLLVMMTSSNVVDCNNNSSQIMEALPSHAIYTQKNITVSPLKINVHSPPFVNHFSFNQTQFH
jgi:hypothetical protein